MNKYSFTMTYDDGSEKPLNLDEFAKKIGLESLIAGRYSILFLLQLFIGFDTGSFNHNMLIHQIRVMEGTEPANGLKPATEFTGKLLKGIWHQHFLQSDLASMAMNIQKGLRKYEIPYANRLVEEAKAAGEERYFLEEHIKGIVDDVVFGNRQRLVDDQLLTGEWIIFAKHNNQNYYLSLAKHKTGDENIRNDLDKIAITCFPFLKDILPDRT